MRPRLPLNNLNTFAAAAECRSFQGAAGRLHVTPSAVSHQIRNLETLLGYRLFDRVDKGVRLTTHGQRLFADIREPLSQLLEAAERAARGQDDNVLALSVAPVFATRWLMPRLKDFHRDYPDINLSMIATTDVLDLGIDEIDAAIRIGRGEWDDAEAELLFRVEIAAVCHPRLVERNAGPFEVGQLSTQKLVENSAMPGLWAEWFQSAGVAAPRRSPGLQVQSAAQVLEAIQSDECIGLVDLHLVRPDLESGRIALACRHTHSEGDGYFLALPRGANRSTAQGSFRRWLRKQVAERASATGS
jgi:LysR family glycine cleavage system transcriptional activator